MREEEVDTEGRALVIQITLEFGNLFTEHIWGVSNLFSWGQPYQAAEWIEDMWSYTANNTDTTSICDCGGQLGASSHVHASQHDRVVDLQEICHGGPELLWRRHVEGWIGYVCEGCGTGKS